MKTSEKGKNLIKSFEGLRTKCYRCSANVLTIGYGHTGADVKEGMIITKEQAEQLLTKDLEKFEKGVSSCVKVTINQNQFDSLVSFAFNCGLGALQSSTLLKKLNAKNFLVAADEFLKWDKVNGKPLAGLTKRRQAERTLFLETPNTTIVNENSLPYEVKTKSVLNIRTAPTVDSKILLTVPKGTVLKVWAIETVDGRKWGKW